MEKKKTIFGNLENQRISELIRTAKLSKWKGAIRIKFAQGHGTVWFVKGEIVHAIYSKDNNVIVGKDALNLLLSTKLGSFFCEDNDLPPDRTIRENLNELFIDTKNSTKPMATTYAVQQEVEEQSVLKTFYSLQEHIPGLESLSLFKGEAFALTTMSNPIEKTWLISQMNTFFDKDNRGLKKLFFEEGNHTLLVVKKGIYAAVLAGKSDISPADLFRAGEEIQRQVKDAKIDATE